MNAPRVPWWHRFPHPKEKLHGYRDCRKDVRPGLRRRPLRDAPRKPDHRPRQSHPQRGDRQGHAARRDRHAQGGRGGETSIQLVLAAGCPVVVKPSEMSAMQTQVLMEAFHEAGLPAGVVNFVTGLGEIVGAELTRSPDVAKIAFTGSTPIGKLVAKSSLDTMKRFTLELGGKSANIILDDADFSKAIPMAVNACFLNNGQACIAASRLLLPENRLDEMKPLIMAAVENIKVGDPADPP